MELDNVNITSELIFPELEGQIGLKQNVWASNGEDPSPARVSFEITDEVVWTTTTGAAPVEAE